MSDGARGYFTANAISSDFFDLMCGEYLGGGCGREVYVCRVDPDFVVKIETGVGRFQNPMEWRVWQEMCDKPEGNWLAPCVSISPNGAVLIQRRTDPLRKREMKKYPKLPNFLGDIKMDNFGILGGKLVCHDYGYVRWGYNTTLRKVDWGVGP